MNNIKLTPTFSGGVETFLGNWEDAIEDLQDVRQAPNKFLARTLLKSAIVDERYQTVTTNLDMMKPPPLPDVCKAEIRREGVKLESSSKEKALRHAHYTSNHEFYYHDREEPLVLCDDDEAITDAAFPLIAATQQRRHDSSNGGYNSRATGLLDHQCKESPWNLPGRVYQSLTPKQRALLNELREAARIRDSPSGTETKGDGGYQYGRNIHNDNSLREGSHIPNAYKPPNKRTVNFAAVDEEAEKHQDWQGPYEVQEPPMEAPSITAEQAQFEEENCNEMQKRWLASVRQINHARVMNISSTCVPIRYSMQTTTTGKGKLYADGCADTGIAAIRNGMVEVYTTKKKVTLVCFDDTLSKKEITIGGAAGAIDLPTGTIVVQMNEVYLLKGATNSVLSNTQAREYGLKVHDVALRHGGKQSI